MLVLIWVEVRRFHRNIELDARYRGIGLERKFYGPIGGDSFDFRGIGNGLIRDDLVHFADVDAIRLVLDVRI